MMQVDVSHVRGHLGIQRPGVKALMCTEIGWNAESCGKFVRARSHGVVAVDVMQEFRG